MADDVHDKLLYALSVHTQESHAGVPSLTCQTCGALYEAIRVSAQAVRPPAPSTRRRRVS